MKKIWIAIAGLTSLISGANASDWLFAGYVKGENNKTERVLYYDNEYISYLPNSVLRVWVKSLKNSRVKAELMDSSKVTQARQYIEVANQKTDAGYIPKYLQINSTNALAKSDVLSITLVELIGQNTALDDKSTMQVQIDCLNMRQKLNLLTTYDEVGNQSQGSGDEPYRKIDPSAPLSSLAKMVCAK